MSALLKCQLDCSRAKLSPGEVEGLEDLLERQPLAVPEDDHLVRLLSQLAFDEAQQVLLVHAGAVVHVCVHLDKVKTHSCGVLLRGKLPGYSTLPLQGSGEMFLFERAISLRDTLLQAVLLVHEYAAHPRH